MKAILAALENSKIDTVGFGNFKIYSGYNNL